MLTRPCTTARKPTGAGRCRRVDFVWVRASRLWRLRSQPAVTQRKTQSSPGGVGAGGALRDGGAGARSDAVGGGSSGTGSTPTGGTRSGSSGTGGTPRVAPAPRAAPVWLGSNRAARVPAADPGWVDRRMAGPRAPISAVYRPAVLPAAVVQALRARAAAGEAAARIAATATTWWGTSLPTARRPAAGCSGIRVRAKTSPVCARGLPCGTTLPSTTAWRCRLWTA